MSFKQIIFVTVFIFTISACNSENTEIIQEPILPSEILTVTPFLSPTDVLMPSSTNTPEPSPTNTNTPEPSPTSTDISLSAPILLSPENNSIFDHYPRTTTLKWTPVEGAVCYVVYVDAWIGYENRNYWKSYIYQATACDTEYTFNFVGKQRGRWRVIAVDKNGNFSLSSTLFYFDYLR